MHGPHAYSLSPWASQWGVWRSCSPQHGHSESTLHWHLLIFCIERHIQASFHWSHSTLLFRMGTVTQWVLLGRFLWGDSRLILEKPASWLHWKPEAHTDPSMAKREVFAKRESFNRTLTLRFFWQEWDNTGHLLPQTRILCSSLVPTGSPYLAWGGNPLSLSVWVSRKGRQSILSGFIQINFLVSGYIEARGGCHTAGLLPSISNSRMGGWTPLSRRYCCLTPIVFSSGISGKMPSELGKMHFTLC